VTLAIRPEKVKIVTDGGMGENRTSATVETVIYVGSSSQYVLRAGPFTFTAHTMNAGAGKALRPGERVQIELPASCLIVLED
jgi:ABC-type Fe3+/spermidine/putrescine transport system ATPase subunit